VGVDGRDLLHCTTQVKKLCAVHNKKPRTWENGASSVPLGNNDGQGNPTPRRLTTSALPVNRAFCHGLKLAVLERTKLIEPTGELIQFPLPRQRGRLIPRWSLTAKVWQRRLSVHRGDRPEKPQTVGHCGESPRSKRGFETAISLQQGCSTSCTDPRCTGHLVGGIAAQGDEIRNLLGIDAIALTNLGGTDTRHLACTDGVEDGGAVGG
jgi:hypothetical protein